MTPATNASTSSSTLRRVSSERRPVVIVGAGLSGLCCARRLRQLGISALVLEAADRVGGRVRTDEVDGFLLDRGFQVLLTSYPEAQRVLDYQALDLRTFEPGALIRAGGRFHRLSDPFRQPIKALSGVLSPVGSLADKLRVASLRRDVVKTRVSELFEREERTTLEALRQRGFSSRMIDRFFRPFFGGVFLEDELETSSRWFELLFRLFSKGLASLPAHGMQQIPEQIARGLGADAVRLGCRVEQVDAGGVVLEGGEVIEAPSVVVATERSVARQWSDALDAVRWRGVWCIYFAAPRSPLSEAVLVLGGDGGMVNNLCVPSVLSSHYAPEGQSLVSVTVLERALDERQLQGEAQLVDAVRTELVDWYGDEVAEWRHLETQQIEHALPAQGPREFTPRAPGFERHGGVIFCGDDLSTSSIQGAMVSGRKAAEAVALELDDQRRRSGS